MNQQEGLWSGKFGSDYTERNKDHNLQSNIELFKKVLNSDMHHVLEFGANIGQNYHAIKTINKCTSYTGVEINKDAFKELKKIEGIQTYNQSIFDFKVDYQRQMVFTKGLLIHISPNDIDKAYQKIYDSAKKHIVLMEYYNPTPLEVEYRGGKDRLWKRDFCGEMLAKYKDLVLIRYGFIYHLDSNPQDDLFYFVMEKR